MKLKLQNFYQFSRLFYKRLAPKLNVFHDLKIQMDPISAMYDEDALTGLFEFFHLNSTQTNLVDIEVSFIKL